MIHVSRRAHQPPLPSPMVLTHHPAPPLAPASFQDVVARALGEAWARLLTWIILVYQFGSCCAYLILLGDSWETLLTSDSSSRGAFVRNPKP